MKNSRQILLAIVGILLVLVYGSCNQPASNADGNTEEVKQALSQYLNTLNSYDQDAKANLYLENADFTFPSGEWLKGREAIRTGTGLAKGQKIEFEIEDVRNLDANNCIVNVNSHFPEWVNESGVKIPDSWSASTMIFKKNNNEWKIAATRVLAARIDNADAEAGIKASWNKFIEYWGKGDAENAAGLFTADAINMVPDVNSTVGKEEIKKLFQQFTSENTIKNIRTTTKELDVVGRTAYEYGIYEDTIEPKNGKSFNRKLRYFSVWKLEADNVWRIHRFIFNDFPGDSGS